MMTAARLEEIRRRIDTLDYGVDGANFKDDAIDLRSALAAFRTPVAKAKEAQ